MALPILPICSEVSLNSSLRGEREKPKAKMMDDSYESSVEDGASSPVQPPPQPPRSSSSAARPFSSGYNSSSSSSSSHQSQTSSRRGHLPPIYESEVDSLPQVAFGNAVGDTADAVVASQDKSLVEKSSSSSSSSRANDARQPKGRSPGKRGRSKRRRSSGRTVLLPESQMVGDDAVLDENENDENDTSATTTFKHKQQPPANTRYLGAILLVCGVFVLEYTRNVGQAAVVTQPSSSNGNIIDRNPRHLKKKRANNNDENGIVARGGSGSIRAAGTSAGGDAFDFSRHQQSQTKNGMTNQGAGPEQYAPSLATSLAHRLLTFRHHEKDGPTIVLPEPYGHLADLEPLPAEDDEHLKQLEDVLSTEDGMQKGPVPFYWHIFRSGGQTAKTILGQCLGLTLAAEVGGMVDDRGSNAEDDDASDHQSKHIRLIRAQGGDTSYLDVNTATVEGLERAAELGLTSRYNPDVVASPLLYEASDILFAPPESDSDGTDQQPRRPQGQLFTLLRHPIDRALSAFYYHRQVGTYGPAGAVLDMDDWIRTDDTETNYLVRSLVHKASGEVSRSDLAVAKEVLRRKTLIGLLDDKEISLRRFKKYFGWTKMHPHQPNRDAMECETKLLEYGWINNNRHPYVEEDSETYALLVEKNLLDLELYEYAKFLFVEQGNDLGFAD